VTRRHPDQPRGRAETSLERKVADRFSIAPGEVTPADVRAYAELTAPKAPKAGRDGPRPLAALLDGYEWARSWGSFLAAVRDGKDSQGARAAIGQVQAARPWNAMGERVPSSGGFLIPESLRQQVLAYMTRAVVRPRAMLLPMTTYRLGLPVLDNPSQANGAQALGGMSFAITEEGAGITPTAPSFGRVALEARKMAGYLQNVPNELLSDSPAFTDDFLPRIIAMGLEWEEDDLFIGSGTGVGEPQALVNAPAAVTVGRGTANEVLHADIVAMAKALHPASKAWGTWLLSEDAFDYLLDLYENPSGGSNAGIVAPPGTLKFNSMTGTWELLGVRAAVTDHQPALGTPGDVMLCDLGLYAIGELGEMTVEISSKGDGFMTDTSNVRIRHRVDGRFWPQQSVTLQNGKIVSALVVLQ
jgi:HK97 family phage major capsid protein